MEIKTSKSGWGSFLVSGLVAIIYGLLALLLPKDIIKTVMIVSGVFLIVAGLICLIISLRRMKMELPWGLLLFEAIAMVASIIKNNSSRDMYGYRVGGDEYVVLCVDLKEDGVIQAMTKMKEQLALTPYSASFGHGMRKDKSDTVDMMLKAAEVEMYNDKAEYYKSHNIDRRRR